MTLFGRSKITTKETIAVDKQDLLSLFAEWITCDYSTLDNKVDKFLEKYKIDSIEFEKYSPTESGWVRVIGKEDTKDNAS